MKHLSFNINKSCNGIHWFYILISLFIVNTSLSAQGFDFENKELLQIAEPMGTSGWIKFRTNFETPPLDVFKTHKAAFGFTNADDMELVSSKSDKLGYAHYKFQQVYNGLKVDGAEFMIHTYQNKVVKGNGELYSKIDIPTGSSISKQQVINYAKRYMPAKVYSWEDQEEENRLKSVKNDPLATYFPSPELMIIPVQNRQQKAIVYRLAYRVEINTKIPHGGNALYVDATSGEIFKVIPLHLNCNPGTGCTLYNGEDQAIDTDQVDDAEFRLLDECRGDGIHTRVLAGSAEITDDDNDWTDDTQCPGVSAHWAVMNTYDYFLDVHERNSFDDNGARINSFMENNGFGQDNAFWNGFSLNFGEGGGGQATDDLVSIDFVAHEFTHAVTGSTAGLIYDGESGALNESFSDIFGTAIEFFVEGNTGDYLIAEDFWITDGYIRSLVDPKAKMESINISSCPGGSLSYAQPDTYEGDNWIDVTLSACDFGGVHINSGVQNHWFYLLAEGSAATDEVNDNGDAFSLTGIGIESAAAIAYRNLAVYLTSSSDFADAREGAINAATDLFGTCSFEVIETAAAWDAVGVEGDDPCPCEEDLVINDNPISSQMYQVQNTITSAGVVAAGSEVVFNAGEEVLLLPNFLASNNFHAFIEGCSPMFRDPNDHTTEYRNIQSETEIARDLTMVQETSIRNFPNPFSTSTLFELQLKETTTVRLEVFDLSGRLVKILLDNQLMDSGIHNIELTAKQMLPGVYIYKFSTEYETKTDKIILKK